MRRRSLVAAVAVALSLGVTPVRSEETARQILDRAKLLDDTTRTWTDRTQVLTLTIYGAGGARRERSLRMYERRDPGGENRSLTFFTAPPEVKGTGFLQWSHPDRDDEQWLYLPQLKRSRRVAAQLRDQSFMGTDFSYRDLQILADIRGWTEAEAASSLIGKEDVDGHGCWVISLAPTGDGTGYSKIVLALDEELLVPRKLTFHDAAGVAVKSLLQGDVKPVGAIPTAYRAVIETLGKGTRTEMVLTGVAYDTGLDDAFFTERQLQSGPR